MSPPNETLKVQLRNIREITLSVTGRKSGRAVSMPVWFVFEGDTLYLLPYQGSDTQWYKNVLRSPTIRVDAGGAQAELKVTFVSDANKVADVVEKFRAKHGARDVKTYYSKFDVAVIAQVG